MPADARYMRAYRRQPRERLSRQARREAQQELLNMHADEYKRLVEKHRKRLGLPD